MRLPWSYVKLLPQLDPDQQRQFAVEVVDRLRAAGHQAFWAGGCVRDHLLGRRPKDYDVATSAMPDAIRDLFGHRRTLALGAAFGVITVLGPREAGQIEVATFRQDVQYTDGRHPDAVTFSTPEADAQRRDFTINGLFFDPVAGEVIDYVGGQADLARRIVRAIGDPRQRFTEDKLRMLRAVRMATTFEFELDSDTQEAIRQMASTLPAVSVERIAAEMRLMLALPSRARAVTLLAELGLLEVILPEVASHVTSGSQDQHWRLALAAMGLLDDPSFELALAALLHGLVTPAAIDEIGRRWKLSNREIDRTRWLVEQQGKLANARQIPWPKMQRILICDGIDQLIALGEAIASARGDDLQGIEHCRQLLTMSASELNPPPLITGDDLIAHGLPAGKVFQALLEAIRDAQLEKQIHSKSEAMVLAEQLFAQRGPDNQTE